MSSYAGPGEYVTVTVEMKDGVARLVGSEPSPWRFDVPEVPAHVTCVQEVRTGRLWVLRSGAWLRWNGGITSGALLLAELLAYAPLVECEDPRSTP